MASKQLQPPQNQYKQPGKQSDMAPAPETERGEHKGSGKLKGKIAVITGGDSGIGRAVAVAFAREGANVAFSYLNEHEDAKEAKRLIEEEGAECLMLAGDLASEEFCKQFIDTVLKQFKKIDILVNNAGVQYTQQSLEDISRGQLEETFRTNVFSMFFVTKAALPHLRSGASIINSSSVTAYRGSAHLLDYSATKGAITSFTRSLALNLVEKGIRVNGVAPGPIWTPLIPASYPADKVATFGSQAPMGRAGQPSEIAPCYVFLASDDSTYMSGQMLHPNGGEVING